MRVAGHRFRGCWFFFEPGNSVICCSLHNSKTMGLRYGNFNHRDGNIRPLFFVVRSEIAVVHLVDVVARKDEEMFRGVPF